MNLPLSTDRLEFYKNTLFDVHGELQSTEQASFLTGTGIRMDGKTLPPGATVNLGSDPPWLVPVEDFAQLFGVFNNSRVIYQKDDQGRSPFAPAGMYATVINLALIKEGQKNKCGLVNVDGSLGLAFSGLFMDNYMLKSDAPQLLGTVAFGLCAMRAFLLGLDNISLIAAGGAGFDKRYCGYQVWPKMGFDAEVVPGEFHDGKAPDLAHCKTVLEAVATNPASWDEWGSQRRMTFDLEPGSTSWTTLINYLRAKGIWSTP
jgi:hypothetical protein